MHYQNTEDNETNFKYFLGLSAKVIVPLSNAATEMAAGFNIGFDAEGKSSLKARLALPETRAEETARTLHFPNSPAHADML